MEISRRARRWLLLGLAMAFAGCASNPGKLPRGARLVGGGLQIDYQAPADGTAILLEKTSGRIVATESLSANNNFRFGPTQNGFDDVVFRMFGPTITNADGNIPLFTLPTNLQFQLYFVREKRE